MTPYTDQELQQFLAKMLPEKIEVDTPELGEMYFLWKINYIGFQIRNTEWLHVCWLVEQGLEDEEIVEYVMRLEDILPIILNKFGRYFGMTNATWQQRAQALAKVKGLV